MWEGSSATRRWLKWGHEHDILCLLQNDIEGFDELIFEHETNETENQVILETEMPTVAPEPELPTLAPQPELSTLNHEPEPQPLPRANEQVPASNVQENNKPARFRQLYEQGLLTLEQNQYSEATKNNTKWGTSVFNGTFLL